MAEGTRLRDQATSDYYAIPAEAVELIRRAPHLKEVAPRVAAR